MKAANKSCLMLRMMQNGQGSRRFILSSILFIFFLCIIAFLNEIRLDYLLRIGQCVNSSTSSSTNTITTTQRDIDILDNHHHHHLNNNNKKDNNNNNNDDDDDELRVLIGILTLPDEYRRRDFLRLVYGIQIPRLTSNARVDVKFVFCNLTREDQKSMIALEILYHNDIIILNCTENMNNGKSYTYFSSLPDIFNENGNYSTSSSSSTTSASASSSSSTSASASSPSSSSTSASASSSSTSSSPPPSSPSHSPPPYHYVMKADDDTYVRLDNLINSLRPLPRHDLYYGYVIPCDSMDPFRHYMSGMGYLISWDIVEWLKVTDIPKQHFQGPEDKVFGDWMKAGRRGKNRFNAKWSMYNYPDPDSKCSHHLWPDTVAVHLLKTPQKWLHTLNYFNVTKDLNPASKFYHF